MRAPFRPGTAEAEFCMPNILAKAPFISRMSAEGVANDMAQDVLMNIYS
jgi:hypothetical protein